VAAVALQTPPPFHFLGLVVAMAGFQVVAGVAVAGLLVDLRLPVATGRMALFVFIGGKEKICVQHNSIKTTS
jgi:hypothetical protein